MLHEMNAIAVISTTHVTLPRPRARASVIDRPA
jgi:hypothetical protein